MRRASAAAGAVVAVAYVATPRANREEIRGLLYDFEVASYCGLVTGDVGEGHRSRPTALVERDRVGREEMDALRERVRQDARADWRNRELGGFRAWCRREARHAAERLAARQQLRVHLSKEAVAEREAFAQSPQPVFKRRHVVGHLDDVVERNAGRLVHLEEQEIGQRRLGALDLGGQQGLFPDVAVEKKVRIRQQRREAVHAAKRQQRALQRALQGRQVQRWLWSQACGHERPNGLAADGRGLVPAGFASVHGERPLLSKSG